jgi:hypothetical protein
VWLAECCTHKAWLDCPQHARLRQGRASGAATALATEQGTQSAVAKRSHTAHHTTQTQCWRAPHMSLVHSPHVSCLVTCSTTISMLTHARCACKTPVMTPASTPMQQGACSSYPPCLCQLAFQSVICNTPHPLTCTASDCAATTAGLKQYTQRTAIHYKTERC